MRQERGSRGSAREKCLGGVDSKASSLTMRNGALSTTASSINVKRWHGAGITKHGFGDKVGSWLRSRRLQSSVPSTYMTLCISILALTLAVLMLNSIRRPRNLSKCNPDRLESTNGSLEERFTIVLNTFKRPERLRIAIEHYSKCGSTVGAIRIPWSEVGVPIPSVETHRELFEKCVDVRFEGPHNTTSINNRFLPIPDVIENSAIFSVDDDVLVSCDSLLFAFEVWRSARENMVGFIPRSHDAIMSEGRLMYKYLYWWRVWWSGTYSIILTKASFFNEKYLSMYTDRMRALEIDKYIDEHKNCEDIAMQFLISNITDTGPIFTSGSYSDSGAVGGISTQHGLGQFTKHYRARSDCLQEFTRRFGRFPLVNSHQFVSQMRNWTPFKTPSSWLEYLSNPF